MRDAGEYAVRGGILDLFAPGMAQPVRLDFFGDQLESIRAFDPESQRTLFPLRGLDLVPMSEVQLTSEFDAPLPSGLCRRPLARRRGAIALYEAISEGRRHPGHEHWLPLFYDHLDTIFDYAGRAPLIFDTLVDEAAHERIALIDDYYDARKSAYDLDPAHAGYKPLKPDLLYLSEAEWRSRAGGARVVRTSPFAQPEGARGLVVDCGSKPGRSFAPERADAERQCVRRGRRPHQGAAGARASASSWRPGPTARASA